MLMLLIPVNLFFVFMVKLSVEVEGGGCSSAEKDFFNKIEKKKGKIRWSKTFDLRKDFLNQCSTADPTAISLIMSKFGRVRG